MLKSDELYAELILDGYHINPPYVRDIIARKGCDRIVAVTDAGFATGARVGNFTMGGVKGAMSPDGSHLVVTGKPNTLFGSCLTDDRGFVNLLNWFTQDMEGIWNRRHEAWSLEKTLPALTQMFSRNACEVTGSAAEGYGTINAGAPADLCVLDIKGDPGAYDVTVEKTIVDGHVAYSADNPK